MKLTKNMWRLAGGVATAALFASSVAQGGDLPKTMIWTSYDFGSAGFAQASGVANAFKKNTARAFVSSRRAPALAVCFL